MDRTQTIHAPILNPRPDGKVEFFPDGALSCDPTGTITYVGPRNTATPSLAPSRRSNGIVIPPFLDAHIHIPQHPIRGHFMDGVGENPPEGRLIAGLNKNVFPAEARCADRAYTINTVENFATDTLAKGVVGGAAYMTVHAPAARIAFENLSPFWRLGPVLMNQNCPAYLRTDESTFEQDHEALVRDFASRLIVTDRFALAVSSELRHKAVRFAAAHGLRMQTHLNEQLREKELVEKTLYPDAKSYTDVYYRDGLLDRDPILAHCIHMTDDELGLVASSKSSIAHCPTSNTLLCSGIMPLDRIKAADIEYAICTDVGASPTTSILAEMAQFLKVHAGRSKRATPREALYRATLAPAKMLKLDNQLGSFELGKPMSFIEVESTGSNFNSADDAITRGLLNLHLDDHLKPALDVLATGKLDVGPHLSVLEQDVRQTAAALDRKVISVTIAGEKIFSRS